MSPAPDRRSLALHLDVDSFSFEGFSNGATIQYREMLQRFQALGIDSAVVTVGQRVSSRWAKRDASLAVQWHFDQSIAVGEYLLAATPQEAPARYRAVIADMLAELRPDLVVLNTPPARLEEAELALFEQVARTDAIRLCFIPDNLFPRAGATEPPRLSRLQVALDAFELVAPSAFIADAVTQAGLGRCELVANVFDRGAVVSRIRKPRYVTFVNPHPMKGVDIFLEIARRLPHRQFQVVRAWPYPPEIACDLPNVTVRPYAPRAADFWSITAALVAPSLCPEGFGRVVVEAQANGIPVVAHSIGGLVEACGDGALMVEPPQISGDPVFPMIAPEEKERSVGAFCAHVEAVLTGGPDIDALRARGRANADRWLGRGERDVARLAARVGPADARPPRLLVLAPHPDDAALSVGGLLEAWRGDKTVVTLFGRSNYMALAGFDEDVDHVSAVRRREDETYCRRVGADLHYWALDEASLRRGGSFEAVFGDDGFDPAGREAATRAAIESRFAEELRTSPDLVLAPAGLGGHVDHLLARDAALHMIRSVPVALYEDLPYAAELSEAEVTEAVEGVAPRASLVLVPLTGGVERKRAGARCYASQVDRTVLDAIGRHALRSPEPAERLWSAELVAPLIARGLAARP